MKIRLTDRCFINGAIREPGEVVDVPLDFDIPVVRERGAQSIVNGKSVIETVERPAAVKEE